MNASDPNYGLNKLLRDVFQFHQKTDCLVAPYPKLMDEPTRELRISLIEEEFQEVVKALRTGTLAQQSKEICDLIYVLIGTCLSSGVNLTPIWEEVQQSNISKAEGLVKREDGKVLKPKNYKRALIKPLIDAQVTHGIERSKNAGTRTDSGV